MGNPVDGNKGKLGRGFMSADKLEEIDVGDGSKPRPMYISAKLDPEYKSKLIDLLKEFKDCAYALFMSRYRAASVCSICLVKARQLSALLDTAKSK